MKVWTPAKVVPTPVIVEAVRLWAIAEVTPDSLMVFEPLPALRDPDNVAESLKLNELLPGPPTMLPKLLNESEPIVPTVGPVRL